ncbi:MAG: adenylate/guanylate cyclase domain-containing protein [marine bacterium B5-7]|nr:MAG: adenylate/guanylate cyclase domain-containing protein [marine bacterium B5-7]
MTDKIEQLLEQIGLVQYLDLFMENDISSDLLGDIDQTTLKDIGVTSAGHRLRILKAIKALPGNVAKEGFDSQYDSVQQKYPDQPTEAERRQLTVMFCDLVGSTELSQRLDPEDLQDVNRAYQEACKQAIERFGGYVAKYMGDGVLAYFGFPQAHEDDAERAVYSALALIDLIIDLELGIGREYGIEIKVRIGIATGLVVVGDLIGEGASRESTVVGETPNLAARIQSLAVPNTVIVGRGTYALCDTRFEFENLGTHRLRGISQRVPVWRAVAPVVSESRFDARTNAGLTTFHGRDQDIAVVLDRWNTAKTGHGQLVLLTGEAGIGKSRIVQVVGEEISTEHHTKLRFQCSPHHSNSALYPVINQLQMSSGFTAKDNAEQKLDKLKKLLESREQNQSKTTTLFASLLSLPVENLDTKLDLTPRELKQQTTEALIRQLTILSDESPVVLEFEDAHWIDPTTLELMSMVVDLIRKLPVLMLVTYRPDFHCPWAGYAHATTLVLDHLTSTYCIPIIMDISGGKKLPQEILNQIIEKTDGIPLFVEELTKTILESGLLIESHDHFELSAPLPPLAIPTSLQDSLMARLDRLAHVKRLAQIGAAIGREFSHELIRAVSGLDDIKLEEALSQLIDAELVFQRGTPHKIIYQFKHALVQDAAYASLLKRSRRQLHSKIATTLESIFPEQINSQPEVLARHWSEGTQIEKAIPYWLAAGKLASTRFAINEAANHLNLGLSLLDSLPRGQERDQMELELRVALGTILRISIGPGAKETQDNYDKAVILCDKLPESPEQFAALWGKWINSMNFKLELGLVWTDRLEALARKLNDPGFLLQAHHAQWTTLFHLGRFADARTHTEQGMHYYDEQAHRHHAALYGGHDPRICAGGFATHALWMLGYPDQSLEIAQKCTYWDSQLEHIGSSLHVIEIHLLLYQFREEPEELVPWLNKLQEICSENDLPEYEGKLTFNKGWLIASRGDTESGIELMRNGLENQRSVGSFEDIPMFSERLAKSLAEVGQVDSGLDYLEKALELTESFSLRYWLAEVHRRMGALLELAGQNEKAIKSYLLALKTAREQQALSLELRAAMSLARYYGVSNQSGAGLSLLKPILGKLPEELDSTDLMNARKLISDLESGVL